MYIYAARFLKRYFGKKQIKQRRVAGKEDPKDDTIKKDERRKLLCIATIDLYRC